eukprot:2026653-Pyramimonas_sp.AAC.1
MRQVAAFAEGELSFLALQGTKSGNPGLPLTDQQKKMQAQQKDQEAKRAAAAKGEASKGGAFSGTQPSRAPRNADSSDKKLSTTTSRWAATCRDWEEGSCLRGISCYFQHAGIPTDEGRCYICGVKGHNTSECTAPGGGRDPEREKHWEAYRARRDKAREEEEKAKGKTKGGRGGGDKGGKGRGKTRTPHSSTAAATQADLSASAPSPARAETARAAALTSAPEVFPAGA